MKLSAVLLAGGESRRMGRDKATIIVAGSPLWWRQIQLLQQLDPIEILVSARSDPTWRPTDTRFVGDEAPSRGPLSGLAAAFEQMTGTHLLALAIDLPFLTATQLTRIKDLTGAACGVLPQIRARSEPLAAIYPREGSPYFVRALRGDDFSLQAITRQMIDAGLLRLFDVPQTQEQLYRNVNVPADLPMSADLKQAMSDIGC